MMAMNDDARPQWPRVLLGLVLGLVLLAALAFALGASMAVLDGAPRQGRAVAMALVGLMVAGAAGWALYRLRPWGSADEPVGPRTRRARLMLGLCVALGVAVGALGATGALVSSGPEALYGDLPLPAPLAATLLALWLVVVPLLSWAWFRAIDEHEARAYNFGGLVALHIYYMGLPAWWIAWRGGFVPEPQHGTLFAAVTIAWLLAWAWRRYR